MSRLEPLQYYKWKWQDWRLSRRVQRMHYISRGFYRELLDEQWAEGSIPHDIDGLAEICGCPKAVMGEYWPEIEPCFDEREDGRLVNAKLETLRTELDAKRIKAVESGRAGAAAKSKYPKGKQANAQQSLPIPSDRQYRREEESREEESREREQGAHSEPLALTAGDTPSEPVAAPQSARAPETPLRPMPTPFARETQPAPRPESFDASTADVGELATEIACAHPRSLLRSLRWNEVRQRDLHGVLDAILAEAQGQGTTEIEAARALLAITKTFAENVPRHEWKFLKPVDEFYLLREYRRDPAEFTHTKKTPGGTDGDITDETIRQARERRAGDGTGPQ